MDDCIFCKIILKQIPSKLEYEDDVCMAFHDINPRAKTHLIIIPKKHIATMKDIGVEDEMLFGRMLKTASDLAKKFSLENSFPGKSVKQNYSVSILYD